MLAKYPSQKIILVYLHHTLHLGEILNTIRRSFNKSYYDESGKSRIKKITVRGALGEP